MQGVAVVLVGAVVLAGLGSWVGVRVVSFLKARVDEMLPDRMVDFCGFIPTADARD